MRVRSTVAVVACLAAVGVSGCSQHTHTCAVSDYAEGTGGYQTPQQALQSVLARPQPGLSRTGWKIGGRGASAVEFVSGDDSVDVVKNRAGKWVVGAVTVCT